MAKRNNNSSIPTPPSEPTITSLKKHHTKSLEGKARLNYEIGNDSADRLYLRIVSNSGGGFFSDEWVAFDAILKTLQAWSEDLPITSPALRTLFKGKSVNTPSFLLAALLREEVIQRMEGKQRHYEIGDVAGFRKRMEILKPRDSASAKRPPKARAKAVTGMAKQV